MNGRTCKKKTIFQFTRFQRISFDFRSEHGKHAGTTSNKIKGNPLKTTKLQHCNFFQVLPFV